MKTLDVNKKMEEFAKRQNEILLNVYIQLMYGKEEGKKLTKAKQVTYLNGKYLLHQLVGSIINLGGFKKEDAIKLIEKLDEKLLKHSDAIRADKNLSTKERKLTAIKCTEDQVKLIEDIRDLLADAEYKKWQDQFLQDPIKMFKAIRAAETVFTSIAAILTVGSLTEKEMNDYISNLNKKVKKSKEA